MGAQYLLSNVRDNFSPGPILDNDAQRVVKIRRIEPGMFGACRVSKQHHVLTDDVEWNDDGLTDERRAAPTDKRSNLVVVGYVVQLL